MEKSFGVAGAVFQSLWHVLSLFEHPLKVLIGLIQDFFKSEKSLSE
jgi:hypothetical protein